MDTLHVKAEGGDGNKLSFILVQGSGLRMCLAVPCSALTLALSYSQMDVGVEQDPVFSFSAGIQQYFFLAYRKPLILSI